MASVQNFLGSVSGLALLALLAAILAFVFFGGRGKTKKRSSLGDAPFRAINPDEDGALDLPVEPEDPDLVERVAVSRHIAELMIADEWSEVGTQMAEWENDLASAAGGARYHDVAADTALSGLQSLIDAAELKSLDELDEAEAEVGHFIDTYQRHPDCHVLATLAARAHLVLGNACRADHWPPELEREAWRRMARHFLKAGEILKDYDPLAYMSPLLAEAHYLQAIGTPGRRASPARVVRNLDQPRSLEPAGLRNPRPSPGRSRHLFGRNFILTEAERALERTEDTLGTGGYALFFLPLLELREGARDLLDADLFASAMLDLASMEASQAEVNQTANALAAEMRATETASPALNDTLYLMIRWHLNVIYPRLWTMPLDAVQSLVQTAALAVPDAGGPTDGNDNMISRAA